MESTIRLAVVQHGDYRQGLEILHSDAPEPYFGMKQSVALLEGFLEGTSYRLISVDAPKYRLKRNGGEIVGLHRPNWPKLSQFPWAWSVYQEIRRFKPTHLLIRTGGVLAYPSLRWAVRNHANSLVVMAGYFASRWPSDAWINRQLVKLLNDRSVYKAANHRRPAALSTIEAGADPQKVVAWDFPDLPKPEDFPIKELGDRTTIDVFFAGELKLGKGIGDLVEAIKLIADGDPPVRLTVCGDGPMRAELEQCSQQLPDGSLRILGRVGNDIVQKLMRESTIVCAPSRRDHSEGLPFVVTEALASRTPLIVADHPAITKMLVDGEGIRIVPSANPRALADCIRAIADDTDAYRKLSEASAVAHSRLASDTTFDKLIYDWRATW